METAKQQIHFYSGGHRLTGYWYPPRTSFEQAPAVVCCHGFSAMIDVQVVGIPEALSDAGYGALTFYCRGLGESGGPRGRVLPWEQVEDIRNAITYLQTRPDVNPKRIGVPTQTHARRATLSGSRVHRCGVLVEQRTTCGCEGRLVT